MHVLFLNHKVVNCGVYQYGKRVYDIIKKSKNITYKYYEIESIDEYNNILRCNKDVKYIIYNYHQTTMNWLKNENINKTTTNIGIIHESPRHLFDIICDVDPDFCDDYEEKIYSLPRPIYEEIDKILLNYKYQDDEFKRFIEYKKNDTIVIGSFGFGFNNKGFDKIVSLINTNYTKAIIKYIIPVAHFDTGRELTVIECKKKCISLNTNTNIEILFYHQFITNEELLLFLKSNDVNIFLYDKMPGRSISSCIDYALSVKKPLVISDSDMFKNIYNDIICVYKNDINTCISNSVDYCKQFLEKYSNQVLIDKFSQIINLEEEGGYLKKTNILKIKSAYYYYENYNPKGIVTKEFKKLYNDYLLALSPHDNSFVVNNHVFLDNAPCIHKSLYVNVSLNTYKGTFIVNENEVFDFDLFINHFYKLCGIDIKNNNNLINESENKDKISNLDLVEMTDKIDIIMTIGDIINNYCINMVSSKQIHNDTYGLSNDIHKQQQIVSYLIKKFPFFYKLLCNIHIKINSITQILDSRFDFETNISNNNVPCENKDKFSLSYDLYKYNKIKQKLIDYFNIFIGSKNICNDKERYISCYVFINDQEDIYRKIPEINYLSLTYDKIYFDIKYKFLIERIFKTPNIYYDLFDNMNKSIYDTIIDITTYNLDKIDKDMFEFEPITYESGGKLGDFINQLSIINEIFYETGRKGVLYIKELPEKYTKFTTGYKKTFEETYDLIMSEKYILDYKIHTGEKTDIDLSSWRPNLKSNKNWKSNFKYNYKVDWCKHKWLNITTDDKWRDINIINFTSYRFINMDTIQKLKTIIDNSSTKNSFYFISFDTFSYHFFVMNTGINIPLYNPKNLEEVAIILKSCKYAYLGLSAIQSICVALHKNHSVFVNDKTAYNLTRLNDADDVYKDVFEMNFDEI